MAVAKSVVGYSDVFKRINEALRGDLRSFIQYSFKYLRPGEQYLHNWHIDAISEYLQAVANGQIKRLIINMPPRALKSMTASVAFPAWMIGRDPTKSIICASYAQSLSNQHSLDCRAIMESDWFQIAFPECRLARDQNEKSKYKTTMNGMRFATSVGGTLTGAGGSCFEYSTLVQTDKGPVKIGVIAENPRKYNVVSYNHLLGREEIKPVIASRKLIKRGLYELRTIKGDTFRCTGDHLIYIKGIGYIEAEGIKPGQQVYYSEYLQNAEQKWSFPDIYSILVWPRLYNLLQKISNSISGFEEKYQKGLCGQLLFSSVRGTTSCGKKFSQYMSDLHETSKSPKNKILFHGMQNDWKTKRHGKKSSSLYSWSMLSSAFLEIKEIYQGSRFTYLSSMQEWIKKIISSSYRSLHSQQLSDKFNNYVPKLSYCTSQLQDNAVSSVTRISDSEHEVYDIQVEENHNFFAEGILVHNCIIVDDPQDPNRAASEVERENANSWMSGTVPSRLNNPENDSIILVQQRLHEEDCTGMLLDKGGWEHLCLPAINDKRRIIQVNGFKKIFEENELLHPERLPKKVLDSLEHDLGSFEFAGQFLQQPVPAGGGILKADWWREWTTKALPPVDYIIQVYDTAFKEHNKSDYSARTTWGIFQYNNKPNIILLEAMNLRLNLPDLKAEAIESYREYDPDIVLIEDKASGTSLIQELKRTGMRLKGMPRPRGDDKVSRAHVACVMLEQAVVWYPQECPWVNEVIRQCASFPNAKHDDLTDTVIDALIFLRHYRRVEVRDDGAVSGGSTTFKPAYGGHYG